jgi:hypothetical protein
MRSTRPTADASTGSKANLSSGASSVTCFFSMASLSFLCFRFATLSFTFSVFASLVFSFKVVVAEDAGVAIELGVSSCHVCNLSMHARPLNHIDQAQYDTDQILRQFSAFIAGSNMPRRHVGETIWTHFHRWVDFHTTNKEKK